MSVDGPRPATATRPRGSASAWWETFFTEQFAAAYLRDADAAETITAGLVDALSLTPGDWVFDQCCGVGRVAGRLAVRGIEVVGVDASSSYVAEARRVIAAQGGRGSVHIGDAFTFVAPRACDAALNWHTSFGYSALDETNRDMLRAAYRSLRPGGRFVLDYPDMDHVRAHFRPRTLRIVDTPEGRLAVERLATLDARRGMLVDRWRFERAGRVVEESWGETRLYDRAALARLLGSTAARWTPPASDMRRRGGSFSWRSARDDPGASTRDLLGGAPRAGPQAGAARRHASRRGARERGVWRRARVLRYPG